MNFGEVAGGCRPTAAPGASEPSIKAKLQNFYGNIIVLHGSVNWFLTHVEVVHSRWEDFIRSSHFQERSEMPLISKPAAAVNSLNGQSTNTDQTG